MRGRFEQVQSRLQGQPAPVAQLAQRHGEIDSLIQRLLNVSANTLREPLADSPVDALFEAVSAQLRELIDVHEPRFYDGTLNDESRPVLARARERQRQLREVLGRLERPSADRIAWDEELRQLSLIFRQHVREQREELFPLLSSPAERTSW